ncbi:hypothetical protein QTP70_029868, partial [Hemibagrus guttatus]
GGMYGTVILSSFLFSLHASCTPLQFHGHHGTVYKVSYRQVSRLEMSSHMYSECCPGWRRVHSLNCNHAVCVQACLNGGSCTRPNHCACPVGWTGRYCQIGARSADAGLVANVTEEVQILRNRVQLLEQKLEMVLAPFSTLFPPEEDMANRNGFLLDRADFLSDQTNFLSHSLRQLDRIDSLSEQVSFLEERLGSCEGELC